MLGITKENQVLLMAWAGAKEVMWAAMQQLPHRSI